MVLILVDFMREKINGFTVNKWKLSVKSVHYF